MKPIRFSLRAQIVVLFLVFSGVVSLLLGYAFSEILRARLIDELRARLLATVELGAPALDAAALGRLAALSAGGLDGQAEPEVEAAADYRKVSQQLNRIRSTAPGVIRYVYTFVATDDPKLARYVVDADVLDLRARAAAGGTVDEADLSLPGSDLDLSTFDVARAVMAGGPPSVDASFVWDDVFHVNSISGYAPIAGLSPPVLLGIDMTDADVRASLGQVTLLSAAVTGASLVLSFFLAFALGLLLTRNLLLLRRTVERFGSQDFSARADLRARDEVGDLAASFNAMAQTIVDYEDRVVAAERQKAQAEVSARLESARNAENAKYLRHVSQGLLLMDSSRRISGQFSRSLQTLFALTESPEGLDFLDLVYPEGGDERQELAEFLSLLQSNSNADDDMIDAVNPFKAKELTVRDGSRIVVDARFVRVEDESAGIMVVFEDLTREKEALRQGEHERQRHDAELESLAAILRHGPALFRDFLQDCRSLLVRTPASPPAPGAVRDELLRGYHSLKGSARALELFAVAELAHRMEDRLVGKAVDPEVPVRLAEAVDDVAATVERFHAFSAATPADELQAFVRSLVSLASGLGAELDKPVVLEPRLQVDQLAQLKELKNPLIHLVRNAVDHGIEGAYERLAAGKPEVGALRLEASRQGGGVLVVVRDDGRGIDFRAVRKAAVNRGLLAADAKPSRAELVRLLFRSGFSSRSEVTDVSGRGVGLDAVADAVRRLGGRLRVRTKKGVGTAVQLFLPDSA